MAPLAAPLAHAKFNLDTAGAAGFFGGEETISAMATVPLYEGRRWLGWFNSPGSYTIAKRFGRVAHSRFWDGLFPGPRDSPAISLGLDGEKGPEYIAVMSGTTLRTGHLGHLTMGRSKELEIEAIKGRVTTPVDIAYLAMKPVKNDLSVKRLPSTSALLGLFPIFVSVGTCAACGAFHDWISFSIILIGIISSGLATFVIGRGKLFIDRAKGPAPGFPSGHGILIGEDGVMVIKGEGRDVNVITTGRFALETDSKQGKAIGVCSLIFLLQLLFQLLLVPQGTLFGQIMFLVSLGVSWGYNTYLSSLEREKIQTLLLFETLGNPEMRRFRSGTMAAMAVFACLLLFHGVERSSLERDRNLRLRILNTCVPDDTEVWMRWKGKVIQQLLDVDETLSYLSLDEADCALPESDRECLWLLIGDAIAAFRAYHRVRSSLPSFSVQERLSGSASGEPDYEEFPDKYQRGEGSDGFIYFTIEEVQ